MKHSSAIASLLLLFAASGVLSCGAGAKALQDSPLGEESDGVFGSVKTVREIEQNLDLAVEFFFGVKDVKDTRRLNTLLPTAYMTLILKNVKTNATFTVAPYDPTAGMPISDNGKHAEPLLAVKPVRVSFPLLLLKEKLTPGDYECKVRYTFNEPRWWAGSRADFQKAGFWRGTVESGPFGLRVHAEKPRERVFKVPTRLVLGKGLTLRFENNDAEQVSLPVRNGHFVSAKYFRGDTMFGMSGPPIPGDVNSVFELRGHKGPFKGTFAIEIFETSDPPCHFWHPTNGYKTLWKRSFELSFTEAELRAKE